MNEASSTIAEIGASWEFSGNSPEAIPRIPKSCFDELARGSNSAFDFLATSGFENAFCFVRGLVACEIAGISPYRGSVSLVIRAFEVIRRRRVEEWSQIADWIVTNHDNPWSPFNFRRTRDQWEVARREFNNPVDIARRAAELERSYEAGKRITHERQLAREHIDKLKKQPPPDSESIRQRIIEELERDAGWPELND